MRLWDTASGACAVTLQGHKSAVSALRYSTAGDLLASGGRDTDVIVWDVVGEAGLYRLRGHKDQVTDLVRHPQREGGGGCAVQQEAAVHVCIATHASKLVMR